MRAVKLCHEDRCIFGVQLLESRIEFLMKNMDSFMNMYRTQGQNFWLRFMLSYRSYIENKFLSAAKYPRYVCYCIPLMKVLNYFFINIHKKMIEGSNTSVKKYIKNLYVVGLNSPQYKKLEPKEWMSFLKTSKHLHNTFNNVIGIPDLSHNKDHNDLAALVYVIYSDYFSSLCSLFELWYFSCDLTDEEVKAIDTKIIYWLPNEVSKPNINKTINYQSSCFEKYLADYWKEGLQKILLTENIHHVFSSHQKRDCCESYDTERNIFNVFGYPSQMVITLFNVWKGVIINDDDEWSTDEELDDDENVSTVTEKNLKEICFLHPKKEKCQKHKNCFIKIIHYAPCMDPFICNGSPLCVFTCQTNLKKEAKPLNVDTFWRSISFTAFSVDKKTREVATYAESNNNDIETFYLGPSSFLRREYTQCIAELYNFDFDPRKTECVKRLRKKLRDKHSGFFQLPVTRDDFKDKSLRTNLMKYADRELLDCKYRFCVLKQEHSLLDFPCTCYNELINSVANESTEVYGRVVNFEKHTFTVPENVKKVNTVSKDINTQINKYINSGGKISNSNPKKKEKKDSDVNVTINCKIDSKNNTTSISMTKTVKSDSKNKPNLENNSQMDSKRNLLDSKNNSMDLKYNAVTDNQKSSSSIVELKNTVASESENSVSTNSSVASLKTNVVSDSKNNVVLNLKTNLNIDRNILKINKNVPIKSSDSFCTENHNFSNSNPSNNSIDPEDEFLKFINDKEDLNCKQNKKNDDTAVENFFKLIGLKDEVEMPEDSMSSNEKLKQNKLKICAFCQKKEIEKKTFKRCSKCKEENFPVHRYYCSRECLVEDWNESHQAEHLKKQKQCS